MKLHSVHLCSLCGLAILIIVLRGAHSVQPLRELRYALFTSGPEGVFDTSGTVPAMELAEEEIFNDSSVLGGFRLTHMPVEDTLVSL